MDISRYGAAAPCFPQAAGVSLPQGRSTSLRATSRGTDRYGPRKKGLGRVRSSWACRLAAGRLPGHRDPLSVARQVGRRQHYSPVGLRRCAALGRRDRVRPCFGQRSWRGTTTPRCHPMILRGQRHSTMVSTYGWKTEIRRPSFVNEPGADTRPLRQVEPASGL